jgi:hypothetical protein
MTYFWLLMHKAEFIKKDPAGEVMHRRGVAQPKLAVRVTRDRDCRTLAAAG